VLLKYTANLRVQRIGMEACSGSHFLARALREQGQHARLIPAQYVKRAARRANPDRPGTPRTLLQTFQSASLHLSAAVLRVDQDSPVKNQLGRILEIMREGIAGGRSAIQGLRSPGSQTSDLVGALSRIQDQLKVKPGVDFRVTVTGRQKHLAIEIQNEIYHFGREALVNAFRHSGAKCIELEFEYSASGLYVRIRDNGCGIESQMLEKGRDGRWGLAGMRERATRIGGVLTILSSSRDWYRGATVDPRQHCVRGFTPSSQLRLTKRHRSLRSKPGNIQHKRAASRRADLMAGNDKRGEFAQERLMPLALICLRGEDIHEDQT